MKVHRVSHNDVLHRARLFLDEQGLHHIVTVNPEFCIEAQKNKKFFSVLNAAALAVPDGIGLQFAAFLQRQRFPARITGADLVGELSALAEKEDKSIMLFGAQRGVAKKAAKELHQLFPRLRIVGAENEENFLGRVRPDRDVVAMIRRRKPDILFVALGAPKQDLWIAHHATELSYTHIAMGVGGTFDYLAGIVPRAPLFIRRIGFEWLWRLFRERPGLRLKRLRRMITATIVFPLAILRTPRP